MRIHESTRIQCRIYRAWILRSEFRKNVTGGRCLPPILNLVTISIVFDRLGFSLKLDKLLQHMKSSRVIRALLFLPIWIRRRFIHANAKAVLRNYDRTVRGGYLIISPSNFPGKFKVDATSDLARRVVQEGVFEPELTALLNDFAGCRGDIVNVGANIGFYAVFFAQNFPNIRRVLAVEPNPEAFEMLQQNIEANGVGHRVEVLQACIGEAPGRVELAIVPDRKSVV